MDIDEQFDQTFTADNTESFCAVPTNSFYLVSLIGVMAGTAYRLCDKPETIGRTEGVDISLPEPRISGQHCQIQVTGDTVLVKDIGSRNGTFVGSERITEPTTIRPGNFLRVGNTLLLLFNGSDEALLRLTRMLDPIVEHLRIVGPGVMEKALGQEEYFRRLLAGRHNIQTLAAKLQHDLLVDRGLRITDNDGLWFCPWCRKQVPEVDVQSDFGLAQGGAYAIARHLLRDCNHYQRGEEPASEEELTNLVSGTPSPIVKMSNKDTVILHKEDVDALRSEIDSLRNQVEENRDKNDYDAELMGQREYVHFQCPYCKKIMVTDKEDLGSDVQCGHCSEIVTVPYSRTCAGSLIADFIIHEELGRGGMGVVYLAHQISLDRLSALKVLADQFVNDSEYIAGFIKEARAAAKLNHPNIVQAYAVGEDTGIFYFAMEYVQGKTMKEIQAKEPVIAVDKAVTVILQIAEALDYAWKEAKIIHRDIKPDNIMITKNGVAKLADLGLARVAGDMDDADGDEVLGTPQYISPEHLTGAPMDVRSDIYSLGATFFHLITGRFAFVGKSVDDIAIKHLQEPVEPPHMVNPDVPKNVSDIIVKMMQKHPNKRYQDAAALVKDLQKVQKQWR